jgi:hypothetical protein
MTAKFDRWGRPIDEDKELVAGGRCPLRSNATKDKPVPTEYGACRTIDCLWWSRQERKCIKFKRPEADTTGGDEA